MNIADQPITKNQPQTIDPTFEIEQTIIDLITVVAGNKHAIFPDDEFCSPTQVAARNRLRQLVEKLQSD